MGVKICPYPDPQLRVVGAPSSPQLIAKLTTVGLDSSQFHESSTSVIILLETKRRGAIEGRIRPPVCRDKVPGLNLGMDIKQGTISLRCVLPLTSTTLRLVKAARLPTTSRLILWSVTRCQTLFAGPSGRASWNDRLSRTREKHNESTRNPLKCRPFLSLRFISRKETFAVHDIIVLLIFFSSSAALQTNMASICNVTGAIRCRQLPRPHKEQAPRNTGRHLSENLGEDGRESHGGSLIAIHGKDGCFV